MRPGPACRLGTRKGADPESLWLEAAPSRLAWETGYARVFEQRNVMRGLGCVGDRGAKEAEGGGGGQAAQRSATTGRHCPPGWRTEGGAEGLRPPAEVGAGGTSGPGWTAGRNLLVLLPQGLRLA